MLWYKSWLDTRWRFVIGLCLLTVLAAGNVFDYRAVQALLPLARSIDTTQAQGPIADAVRDAIAVQRDFRGFIWYQWFRQNLSQIGTLFAILLGSGGLIRGSSSGAYYTLTLPATRKRVIGTRAATGLAELLTLTVVPSLALPLLAPAVGEHLGLGDVLVHGACAFVAATAFFSLAFFLSTVFADMWRPLLVAAVVAIVTAFCELVFERIAPGIAGYGVFHAMSGESYFRAGALPWAGLLVSTVLSAGLLTGAVARFSKQDF